MAVISNQEAFFRQLSEGDMPQAYYAPYQEFLSHVPGDHLIHLIFSCGCWRFIEARALYRGRGTQNVLGSSTLLQPHQKWVYQWHYYYPMTQTDCGARVVDESWIRRRLRVFSMRVGYTHGYADHVFRSKANEAITSQREVVGDLAR